MAVEKKALTKKSPAKAKNERKGSRIKKFLSEVIAEIKMVTWPTRKQVMVYTGAVLVFVIIFVIVIFVLDYGIMGPLLQALTGQTFK